MSHESVPQECPTRVSHKSVLQKCPTRVSYKRVPQECPTRVSYKSAPQECPTKMSHKSVLQGCSARMSHVTQGVPQGCTRVSQKNFPKRMCPTRVSHKTVSYKSVKNCLAVCLRIRVCMRVRGFHFVVSRPPLNSEGSIFRRSLQARGWICCSPSFDIETFLSDLPHLKRHLTVMACFGNGPCEGAWGGQP